MSKLTYRLAGMVAMLLAFYAAGHALKYLLQSEGFGGAAWHFPVLGVLLMGSPMLGLILFELLSGRALSWGFSVISKHEAPREYWSCIMWHFIFLVVIAAGIWVASFQAQK